MLGEPGAVHTPQQKKAKHEAVVKKQQYTSLRHFGKFNNLTLIGSVCNAEDLLKVAKGNRRNRGQFNGKVQARDFMTKAQAKASANVGWKMSVVATKPKIHSPEFNDTTLDGTLKDGMPGMLDSRNRMIVGGLRDKVVAVYRKENRKEIGSALA